MSPRRCYPHPTQSHLIMNAQTEQKLIDDLHKLVAISPHRDELLQLMQEQIDDDLMNCAIVHNQQ